MSRRRCCCGTPGCVDCSNDTPQQLLLTLPAFGNTGWCDLCANWAGDYILTQVAPAACLWQTQVWDPCGFCAFILEADLLAPGLRVLLYCGLDTATYAITQAHPFACDAIDTDLPITARPLFEMCVYPDIVHLTAL